MKVPWTNKTKDRAKKAKAGAPKKRVASHPVVKYFIPRYDELALFLMSLAFILLFSTHPEMRARSFYLFFDGSKFRGWSAISLVFCVLGILFSLYHVFTTRKKEVYERTAMFFFAIFAVLALGTLLLIKPFLAVIALSLVTVLILRPLYAWIGGRRRLEGHTSLAVTLTMLIAIIIKQTGNNRVVWRTIAWLMLACDFIHIAGTYM